MKRTASVLALAAVASMLLTSCFRDGIWIVGVDIQPGLYRSLDAEPGRLCYYRRLDANGAEISTLGDNFSSRGNGPQYVEVAPGDASLETSGCEMWVAAPPDQSALPAGPTLPDGMWRVGVDIAPGTYSAGGSATCEWQRLSNARHDVTSVIESGLIAAGQFKLVTVSANDSFFWTRGCEPWQRLQVP